ncbi:MAG TPA: hypothetical protein VEY67_04485 [Candidatus Dormibacteraeota bacterium]|nr:hypothetical protein [Candidatus Dormibacteraeota bacterium]
MDPLLEPSPAPDLPRSSRRRVLAIGGVGTLVLGGAVALAVVGGPATVLAASTGSSPSPAASAPATGAGAPCGALGPDHEAVSDTSVAAKAIGIGESDLTTALQQGQTIAAVAKAHSVDVQKVIDALVADANDELATAVKNGTITQAQADTEKAEVTARVTAQVNGTFGPGGPGHRGPDGDHPGFVPGSGAAPAGPGTTAAPASPNA